MALDGPMTTPVILPDLDETARATQRYLDALTVLSESELREPSTLPGWDRAHVVAHLSRNADALAGVLRDVVAGEPPLMYRSQEVRDTDIESTAAHGADDLLADTRRACAGWLEAASAVEAAHLGVPVQRTPGGQVFPVSEVGRMRRTEVEIHHADLTIGYGAADWPADFTDALVRRRVHELRDGPPMLLRAVGADTEVWRVGAGDGPEVTGTPAALAWWLVGRGDGDGLTCSAGELPTLARWR
jgi:maleylpyruvate isomerase